MELWMCSDCGLQMVIDRKNVDTGGHKNCGCPACEVTRLNRAIDRIGLYCAGTEMNNVSEFVIRVKSGGQF